jgi:hypothetical protein
MVVQPLRTSGRWVAIPKNVSCHWGHRQIIKKLNLSGIVHVRQKGIIHVLYNQLD